MFSFVQILAVHVINGEMLCSELKIEWPVLEEYDN